MKQYRYKNPKWLRLIKLFDKAGYIFIKPFLKRPLNPIDLSQVKKILVIKLDHIGDMVLAIPALKILKTNFPMAQVSIVVGPWGKDLMLSCPYVDKVIVYNPQWLSQDQGKKKISLTATIKLIKELRKERFDLFFELRGDLFSLIIGYLSKIPCRAGYGIGGAGWLLTHEAVFNQKKHQVQIMTDIISTVSPSLSGQDPAPEIFINNADRQWAQTWMEENINPALPLTAIHLGAGYPSKCWPPDNYLTLIKRLVEEAGHQVTLIGAKGDLKHLNAIRTRLPRNTHILIGKSGINQMAALLEHCDFFIGNDSAPAHIAAAVTKNPVIVIFSAANSSARWAPVGKKVQIISRENSLTCSGCEQYACKKMDCMKAIGADEVFNAVLMNNG